MRTSWMVGLQAAVVVGLIVMRSATAGWLFAIFVITLIGPLLAAVPTIVAVALHARGERLRWPVVLPFTAAVLTMVAAAGLIQDGGDSGNGWTPIVASVDRDIELTREVSLLLNSIGYYSAMAYLLVLVWLVVAAVMSTRRRMAEVMR